MLFSKAGLLSIATVLMACVTFVRTYVIIEPEHKDSLPLQQDTRLLYLLKVLEGLESLELSKDEQKYLPSISKQTNLPDTSRMSFLSKMEARRSKLSGWRLPIRENKDFSDDVIALDKKDYAILPPQSEWCRMMGFRRCHGSSSR
ncbi:uncharacterized protein LOC128221119 [Mya arenaria]|uniref:uncharacterized protein LOC128221119 n=1 Tax=Mya arenaria TaxID=6604 RepID=UPI0022E411A3|nr:uncharacterized protein LOC128221119 [Mya arenaria]